MSLLSSTNEEFERVAPPYKEALKKAGYDENIKYQKPINGQRKNRGRNKLWFNPPFSLTVKTNVTKLYADIINKAFPAVQQE